MPRAPSTEFETSKTTVKDALVKLLLREPVLGYFAKSTDIYLVDSSDVRCKNGYAWTDGSSIYICSSIAGVSNALDYTAFVIAHESMHIILQHVERAKQFIGELDGVAMNVVADAVVNERIRHVIPSHANVVTCDDVEHHIGIPSDVCRERSFEELLHAILPRKEKLGLSIARLARKLESRDIINTESCGAESNAGKPCGCSSHNGSQQKDNSQTDCNARSGSGCSLKDKDGKAGKGQGGQPQQSQGSRQSGEGRIEKVNEGSSSSPQSRFAEAVFVASMTAGTVPGWAKRVVDELLKPKINWKAVLRQYLSQGMRVKRTWARESRKIEGMPGKTLHGKPKVAVLVDVSGSISNKQLAEFVSELLGIVGEASHIDVVFWDTDVTAVKTVKSKGDIPLLWIDGGGGTMIRKALERAVNGRYDEIIIMSDWEIADLSAPEVVRMLEQNKHKIIAVTSGSEPPQILRRRIRLE